MGKSMSMSGGTHWDADDERDGCGGDGECEDWSDEPDCDGDHLAAGHDWTSEGCGGLAENPGVQSLGGTTYGYTSRCRHCGMRCVEIRYGSQRDPYQCDRRTYDAEVYEPEIRCHCGAITGERCEWTGPASETVRVEYMPEYLRDTAEAAGTWAGVAATIRCERTCADRLAHVWRDGERTAEMAPWIEVMP